MAAGSRLTAAPRKASRPRNFPRKRVSAPARPAPAAAPGSCYAINPARDFGPRLFAWLAGWGQTALPGTVDGAFSWYFWIPIIGPLIGGVIGVLIYDWFIGDVLQARARLQESTPPGRAGGETPPAAEPKKTAET
jgi:glycerol uptake facilitator protein